MKFRSFAVRCVLAAIALLPAQLFAQSRVSDDPALKNLIATERAYAQLAIDSTTQRAFNRYFAADGIVFRPRAIPALEYFRVRPMAPAILRVWEPVLADVSRAGDLGYTTGPWVASRRDTRADPSFGQYLTIWRRQNDGSWKVEIDAGIGHGADAKGPSGVVAAPPRSEWRAAKPETTGSVKSSLLRADSALAAASDAKGVAAAFANATAPNVRMLRSGHFPITSDSLAAALAATQRYSWIPVAAHVASSGDLGYTRGNFMLVTKGDRGQVVEKGDYIRVWRRTRDGRWVIALDLTSTDPRLR
jgi:ketosteroid isomerase-like protein